MKDDYTNMWPDGPGAILYEIDSSANNRYPTVVADDDNIMIICETDESGNQDIICYYSSDGGESWNISIVVGTDDDEVYPDAVSLGGLNARCTFVKNNNLYFTETIDGGMTWSNLNKVNDVDNSVPFEYRAAETCEQAVTWMDDQNGDFNIYFDSLKNTPPNAPTVTGINTGKPDMSYEFTFNAIDPEGDNVRYIIDWDDGNIDTTGLNPSEADVIVSHSWSETGSYECSVYAEDEYVAEGDETIFTIVIKRSKSMPNSILKWLQSHPNLFPIIRYILGL
jgi:hypothetical protein